MTNKNVNVDVDRSPAHLLGFSEIERFGGVLAAFIGRSRWNKFCVRTSRKGMPEI
jgi:hypothetical protein